MGFWKIVGSDSDQSKWYCPNGFLIVVLRSPNLVDFSSKIRCQVFECFLVCLFCFFKKTCGLKFFCFSPCFFSIFLLPVSSGCGCWLLVALMFLMYLLFLVFSLYVKSYYLFYSFVCLAFLLFWLFWLFVSSSPTSFPLYKAFGSFCFFFIFLPLLVIILVVFLLKIKEPSISINDTILISLSASTKVLLSYPQHI